MYVFELFGISGNDVWAHDGWREIIEALIDSKPWVQDKASNYLVNIIEHLAAKDPNISLSSSAENCINYINWISTFDIFKGNIWNKSWFLGLIPNSLIYEFNAV